MKLSSVQFILLSVVISLALMSCHQKKQPTSKYTEAQIDSIYEHVDTSAMPVIKFETDKHDFGKANAGEIINYAYKFTNTGKSLLVISNVTASCGCTVADFPKNPIEPGQSSEVTVKFNSEGRRGIQSKTITVFANTVPPTTSLILQGEVVEK